MISVKKVKKFSKCLIQAVEATPQLVSCKEDIYTFCAMLMDWAKGEYKHISRRTGIIVGVCIGYIICPIDLLPDFIPIIGQIDDIAVICFMLRVLKEEISFYRTWASLKNNDIIDTE